MSITGETDYNVQNIGNEASCKLQSQDTGTIFDEDIEKEHLKQRFKEVRCTTCPNLDEIKSFSFGGISSRFQICRKHLNSMNKLDVKNQPFYSWECLTIHTEDRDIDLVIRNQECMDMLLKLLIYKTNSLNGLKGSAKSVEDLIV